MNYKFIFIIFKFNLIILFINLITYSYFYKKEKKIKLINYNENLEFNSENKIVDENIIKYPKNISIYKYLKIPKISIVLKNDNYKEEKTQFLKIINQLKTNNYDNNFEIILLISKEISLIYNNIIINYLINQDNIKVIEKNENYIIKLIDIIEGKFTLFLDNFLFLEKDLLELFYNNTYGKINNIYE